MTEPHYDPALRRDTPLARRLIALIRDSGPMSVHDYMDACLNDIEHGYYRTRTAIGGSGDFITAPEISQVFGELIGLWCAVVWQQMGSPPQVNLIELGAGRGTLLADALRAARILPAFGAALSVHIVDQNPVLIDAQRAMLDACGATTVWHTSLETLPAAAPSIWIANEFLDTLPVDQIERRDGLWSTRMVGIDGPGHLAFVPAPAAWPRHTDGDMVPSQTAAVLRDGAIRESQPGQAIALAAVRRAAASAPLAALFIDYGHSEATFGDTLQAVRAHRAEHILTSPGEADLSCHVDFENFAFHTSLHAQPQIATDGPVTQAEFLGRLGVMERASKLMAANPAKANAIEMGVARLMAPQGMGTRFKAIGVRSAGLPPLPGF